MFERIFEIKMVNIWSFLFIYHSQMFVFLSIIKVPYKNLLLSTNTYSPPITDLSHTKFIKAFY